MLKYIYNTGGTRCLNLHHKQRLSLASVTTYLGLNHMDVVDRHPCMLRYTEGRIILLGKHVHKSIGEGRGRLALHKRTFLVKKAYLTSVDNDVLQFVTCMNIIGEPTMIGKESGVQWTRNLEKSLS